MFTVEHYLVSRFYLTCKSNFRDVFHYLPVPNKSTVSRVVNYYRDTGTVHRLASDTWNNVNTCITERGGRYRHLIWHRFCFLISLWFTFWQIERVSGMACVTFRSLCIWQLFTAALSFLTNVLDFRSHSKGIQFESGLVTGILIFLFP